METDSVFTNISSKIKTSAKVVCVLGVIASVALAIYFFVKAGEATSGDTLMSYAVGDSLAGVYKPLGWGFLIGGPIFFVIKSFLIYGFGELVESAANSGSTNSTSVVSLTKLEEIEKPVNNSIFCANCGATVSEADKYCKVCSIKLDDEPNEKQCFCPNCGTLLEAGHNYCPVCGTNT